MIQLRDYQYDLIQRTREALKHNRRVILQAPTGAGKTALTVYMMSKAAEQGKSSIFCVHQRELMTQTSRALWEQNLQHGQIISGKRHSSMPVQVASVQTLVNRLDQYQEPSLIIIDEAHRSAANTYRKIMDYWPRAKVIGLTATPERTDGKGLDDLFDTIVEGPPIKQLIADGWLSDYEIYAPPKVADTSSVKTKGGDYDQGQAGVAMDKPHITGDAIGHYNKIIPGQRCLAMCCTVNHAENVCDQYKANGISAEVIEGDMSSKERDACLQRLASGQTKVVCGVSLVLEGLDIPAIDAIQWLRPTQSLIVWMQGNGRGFRPAPGKEQLTILDHVDNARKHGLPCSPRRWSLQGRTKKQRKADQEAAEVATQQCNTCFHIFRPGPSHCPSCGAAVEKRQKPEIEVVDGELHKIEMERAREEQKREQKREQGRARTLEDLVALGVRREIKNPSGWAAHLYASRESRKPTPEDFKQAKSIQRELQLCHTQSV